MTATDKMTGTRPQRVALVTGSSRGIGRAIALGLAADGYDVAVNYRRDHNAAVATVEAIEALGRRAVAFAASIDDESACESLTDDVLAAFSGVDLLVHSAGIASRGNAVADTPLDEVVRLMRGHVFGAYVITSKLLPSLRRRQGGVIFISSTATLSMPANGAPYNMAKAAMEALAQTLAKEERHEGVHVNVVAPGLVETDMGRRMVKARFGSDDMRSRDAEMPFGRVCQPDDVAGVVRWLASPAAGYVSGEKVNVHGGG